MGSTKHNENINVYGGLSASTISATSISVTNYNGLPIDIRITGGTYSNGTATYTNNTGGTFTVTGFVSSTASTYSFNSNGTGIQPALGNNIASGFSSTIGGGQNNIASGNATSIGGGNSNTASGNYASVGGGRNNTANNLYSTVLGGSGNTASGMVSMVFGTSSTASNTGTIVLGNNINGSTANTTYVDRLNITTVSTGTTVNNLGVDSSGNIIVSSPRIQLVVSASTVTPAATSDEVIITAQGGAIQFLNPTGSTVQGQAIMIRIKDDGTGRAITYDTQYRAIGITLPTTTVANKTTYIGMINNSTDTKWDCISTVTEA